MSKTKSKLSSSLKERGYKLTPQRKAILKVLTNTHDHLTPAQIHARMKNGNSGIGLATVYRTLDILVELELVCPVYDKGGAISYVAARTSGHHHHLVCSGCGAVVDFTDCDLEDLEQRISLVTGFEIEGHFLELRGLCYDCQEKAST